MDKITDTYIKRLKVYQHLNVHLENGQIIASITHTRLSQLLPFSSFFTESYVNILGKDTEVNQKKYRQLFEKYDLPINNLLSDEYDFSDGITSG